MSSPKTIVSTQPFQDPQGNVLANGILILSLSYPAHASGGGELAPTQVVIALDANGKIPAGTLLWANDQLVPSGTVYRAVLRNSNKDLVADFGYWLVIGPSPIDLSQETPTIMGVSFPSLSQIIGYFTVSLAGPTYNYDATNGNNAQFTLTGSVTFAVINATVGLIYTFQIIQDATGGRTFTWAGNFKGAIVVDTTANAITTQSFLYNGTNFVATSPGTIN